MRLRGSRLMPLNQMKVYIRLHATAGKIVWEGEVCTQATGKNYSEFRNGGRKSDFSLCCRSKSFGIGATGNVACVTQ